MDRAMDVHVANNGRMVLPKSVRETLGVEKGGAIVLSVVDGEVKLTPIRHSVARAQALYRQHARGAFSVDDFLKERREEAAREDNDA